MKTCIIIPTCGKGDIISCLKSIIQYTDTSNVRILISANGCPSHTIEAIKSLKCCELIINNQQLGFPKAVNIALKNITNSHVVLINDDLVIQEPWLHLFVNALDKADIIGDIVFRIDFFIAGKYISFNVVSFHFALIKWQVFEKIGFLDESFSPGYGEDIDFCFKAIRNNFKLLEIPIHNKHIQGQSLESNNWEIGLSRIPDQCIKHMIDEGHILGTPWSCSNHKLKNDQWVFCPDCVQNYVNFQNTR